MQGILNIFIPPLLLLTPPRSILTSLPLSNYHRPFNFYNQQNPICAIHILLGMGLSIGIRFTYWRPHPPQKTGSPTSREHLQPVVTQLGIALTCYHPPLILEHYGLILFRSCAFNISFMLMYALVLSYPDCFTKVLPNLWLSLILLPYLLRLSLSFDGMAVPLLTLLLLSQLSMGMLCFLDENGQGDHGLEGGSHI